MPACQQGSARLYREDISTISGQRQAQVALALAMAEFEPFGSRDVYYLSEWSKRKGPSCSASHATGERMLYLLYHAPQPGRVAGEDWGPLRPRLPGVCPWHCFPHIPPVLVSGTESWGCGRDECTMCLVHLCPQRPAQCLAQGSPP